MPRLSARLADLQPSAVREMLQAAQQPDVISFAGGLPAEHSFDELDLSPPPREMLQYGPTEGEPPLREAIARRLASIGLDCPAERVMVLSGSQQGIDLAAKLVIDPGVVVAVENPCYLAALQVFRFFGARLQPFEVGEPRWASRAPALAYVTPTFQNPTGGCWTSEERSAFAGACAGNDVVLFEDDPYRDLVYDPCDRRPVCGFAPDGASWIYQGSFSKTFAPGLRLGFLAASENLFTLLVRLKQASDLHANRLSQWRVLQYLSAAGREARLDRVVGAYREARDAFDASLRRHLGNLASWRTPPGGLFFWVDLPRDVDEDALLARCLQRGVLFTPGRHFRVEPGPPGIRLNFSAASPERAEQGLAVIGEELRALRS
jgi:DNA-binding transcriptional MocR family regulator